eukprot:10655_1
MKSRTAIQLIIFVLFASKCNADPPLCPSHGDVDIAHLELQLDCPAFVGKGTPFFSCTPLGPKQLKLYKNLCPKITLTPGAPHMFGATLTMKSVEVDPIDHTLGCHFDNTITLCEKSYSGPISGMQILFIMETAPDIKAARNQFKARMHVADGIKDFKSWGLQVQYKLKSARAHAEYDDEYERTNVQQRSYVQHSLVEWDEMYGMAVISFFLLMIFMTIGCLCCLFGGIAGYVVAQKYKQKDFTQIE